MPVQGELKHVVRARQIVEIAVRRCAVGAAAWFFHASLCSRLAGIKVTPFSPELRLHLQNV